MSETSLRSPRNPFSRWSTALVLVLAAVALSGCISSGSSSPSGGAQGSGSVTLAWTPPTTRSDGEPISPGEIGGYNVHYGTSSGNYSRKEDVQYPNDQVSINNLKPGTYHFALKVYDTQGLQSGFSEEVVVTVN